MPSSQLTGLRARTQGATRSQLTGLRARTLPIGRSQLTGLRARTQLTARSQLTGLRARTLATSGPTVIVTGPSVVEVKDVFTLSLAGSSGGPFTGYQWSQLSGPTATLVANGVTATVTAPAVRPTATGFPNDGPIPMVFQGVVEKNGGAVQAAATITVNVYPHLTWNNAGPLYWHLP